MSLSWHVVFFSGLLIFLPREGQGEFESFDRKRIHTTSTPWSKDEWQKFADGVVPALPKDRLPISRRLNRWWSAALHRIEPSVKRSSSYDTPDAQHWVDGECGKTDFVQEDNENDDHTHAGVPPKHLGVALGSAIQSLLSDPQRLKRWSGKAIQFYLLWYLATSVWKALGEALEDLSADTLNGDPCFCSRQDLRTLLLYLENPTITVALPRALIDLGEDLRAAGLPIHASLAGGKPSIESLFQDLTRTEASILKQCLWKPPVAVRKEPGAMWDSVLGLEDVKERLLLTVSSSSPNNGQINNLIHETQQAYASLLKGTETSSTSQHHGVLLFGEPGCGKSFLVQALAAKLRWPCLVVTPSVLMRKYVGETNLKVRALFSMIQSKLSPCVVVLDELDGLFRERHDQENDASRELKTEFLQWMSGIQASSSNSVEDRHLPIIVGATNRPADVDSAVLRRLPQRFYIGPPNYATRCQIFQRMLQHVPLAEDFDIALLSQKTEGYTPSDIQQVLRTAARGGPLKEAIIFEERQKRLGPTSLAKGAVRPLSTQDVLVGLSHIHATPLSQSYRRDLQNFAKLNDGSEMNSDGNHEHIRSSHLGYHFAHIGTLQAPLHDTRAGQHGNSDNEESVGNSDDNDDDSDEEDDEFEL